MTSRPKVYDCFTFFNELDLLEIRLVEHDPAVDRFVLVEAAQTFQGAPKPLYFYENRDRFRPWLDKIEYVAVDFPDRIAIRPGHSPTWNREYYQRNQIVRGLAGAAPRDLVMVSDVDEIVAQDVLLEAVACDASRRCVTAFMTHLHQFYMRHRAPGYRWTRARMLERRAYTTAQQVRSLRFEQKTFWGRLGLETARMRVRNWERCGVFRPLRLIENAGWHFSSIGGYDAWKRKVDSYSHEEYKNLLASEQDVLDALRGYDVVGLEEMPILVRRQPARFEGLLAAPSLLVA